MGEPAERDAPTSCPLCGGTERRRLVTKRGCDVVRCRDCRLVYVWPPPSREEVEALYSAGDYHAVIDESERRRYFARRLRQIEKFAPRGGRILDVGCSKGYFLEAARANGWEAVGVELNRRAVEDARARGLDVRHGDLCDLALDEESFDVVTLFDVLEHTAAPRALLAACRAVLRLGGLLVVTTPDIGGLVPRVTYGLFACTLGAWEHPTPPGHLVQFSRRTLRRALGAEGFEALRERSEHIPIAYSVGKLENSIMAVLAGRHRNPPTADGRRPTADGRRQSPLRRVPRYGVRALSWLAIGLAGLAARATGWGDSMFVAARRTQTEGGRSEPLESS
ncbi:MAG TPA: class I SAM-dependent methyltransferase [Planctomycetota bacterium]|nr:class I SAM-dependent methyltransferase [Planctomycetota bacterium]